ncbi:uncharacterized protein LOC119547223 isoform X2 [Drosophila subpulchrella]|uniref:uncharacterized protein LOC119547223 isoform X2 n=1 Tax=Drosophila subpulchrella TaxID=1486046 RepID=UPI0018A15FA5|nr:uncharacterized protein LOC119547223 isoform X2 [Drosophila subpulchrella]
MKITAIFLLPNLNYSTTLVELHAAATKGVTEIVEKYKVSSMGNTEFSQWIKKLDIVSKKSPMEEQFKVRAQFDLYNNRRQDLENSITNRITTIDNLINKLLIENTKKCLQFYRRQKRSLQMAYKFSNAIKLTNLLRNKKQCDPENKSNESTENDEYSYY